MRISLVICFSALTAVYSDTAQAVDVDIEKLAQEELGSWVEPDDLREIIFQAKAGLPTPVAQSEWCETIVPWLAGTRDLLGFNALGRPTCVAMVELPSEVRGELWVMSRARFKNLSDYDQRITAFQVFRVNRPRLEMSAEEIGLWVQALGIPSEYADSARSKTTVGDVGFLEGLFVYDAFVEEPALARFAAEVLGNTPAITVRLYAPEVVLYPGGGYSTAYTIVCTKELCLYAKTEGWDA